MKPEILMQRVLEQVRINQPIKAKKIANILAQEFELEVVRKDVNSVLYSLKGSGQVSVNDDFEWRIANDSKITTNAPRASLRKPTKSPPVLKPIYSPDADKSNLTFVYTQEQQSIIDLEPSSHLLIRGQAGSGKTTVLSARAGSIVSTMSGGTILFLTYNAALCSYVKKIFEIAGVGRGIDVHTFHDWSKVTANNLGYSLTSWVDESKRKGAIERSIDESLSAGKSHRLFDLVSNPDYLQWWSDEVAWMFGQRLNTISEYQNTERVGRGTSIRLSSADRSVVWNIFESYTQWLTDTSQEDNDNPGGLILDALSNDDSVLPETLRYDHVLIDEVQDFDRSWLIAVNKVPRVSLCLAGDIAQRIYKRNFTWKSVGINVQGQRSRRLGSTHRATKQTMDVAACFLADNDVTKDPDYSKPQSSAKSGDKVKLIIASDAKSAYNAGYDLVAAKYKRVRTTSVAIALPFTRQLYPASKALEERGVRCSIAKGASLGKTAGGVVVSTFHQLKGLEFDHVVVFGLHDSQFPERFLATVADEDKHEQMYRLKRLLYVVMTRARQNVTLISSDPITRYIKDVPAEFVDITRVNSG